MKDRLSTIALTEIPISSVTIGVRRRHKLGNLRSLAASIEAHGLLHPIIVRNGHELVSGHRRLEACRQLGRKTITARHVETMSTDELRAIELDENAQRLALADFETSSARLAQIHQAEADLKAKAAAKETRPKPGQVSGKRGPARKPGSRRDVADETGISKAEQGRVERHVATAEQYPFMQRPEWKQHHVLEAAEVIGKIPGADRAPIAALLDQDAIPPKTAIGILQNVATLPAVERREIFRLAESPDVHDRTTALTKAAALPPPVDPGLTWLGDADAALQKAAKVCRSQQFKPAITALSAEAMQLLKAFQEANAHARRASAVAAHGDSQVAP